MAVKFHQPANGGQILHGREVFIPGVSLAFEDPDAEPFFIKAGWAEATEEPPALTYSQERVSIDPEAVFADGPSKGQPVLSGEG